MTSAAALSARQQAAATVRARLNLPPTPTAWTYAERVAYNKALAAYILASPERFNDSTLTTAEVVTKKDYADLADASFDFSDFAVEAVKPVQNLGEGVKNAFNLAPWVVPAAAVAAVLILLAALARRTGARA